MNDAPLFSAHWFRVRDLEPSLAPDVLVQPRTYRGVPSHVMHRASTNAHHRIDGLAYELVARLDGRTRVGEIWEDAQRTHGSAAPTQPEFLGLLASLHAADLIVIDRELDAERLFRRAGDDARRELRQRLPSPLYLRFPLCDPDRWLTAIDARLRRLSGPAILVTWFITLMTALTALLPELPALRAEIAAVDVLSPLHLGAFLVIWTLMKSVHELAHALTLKRFGQEVHEFGIALMVLLPNPYTDATAATLLPDKLRRMQVSAAGIGAELGLTALAALLWTVSSGTVHELALLVMLTGGLSTLVFNANPLLKFDGYHVLADWIEIPNLAERARRRLWATLGALLLSIPDTERSTCAPGERAWLLGYGCLSGAYRIALMLSIAWFLSGRYFFFGVLLSLWILATLVLVPLGRLTAYLARLPDGRRARSSSLAATGLFVVVLLVTLLPVPHRTLADGVVWLPEHAILRAGNRCEVVDVMVAPGSEVTAATPLLACTDPDLEAERERAGARVRELAAGRAGLATIDPVRHRVLGTELESAEAALASIDRRRGLQKVSSEIDGRFLTEGQGALEGRHFREGEVIGFVIPPERRTIRVALTQAEIGDLDRSHPSIEVAVLEHAESRVASRFRTHIVSRTPAPTTRVVSPALTSLGGGRLRATELADGLRFDEAAFDLELAWPEDAPQSRVGGRLHVRFEHPPTSMATRLTNSLRRTFMGRASS